MANQKIVNGQVYTETYDEPGTYMLGTKSKSRSESGRLYSGSQLDQKLSDQNQLSAYNAQTLAQAATQNLSANAANKLSELLSNPSSIESQPGYQWAYNQGLEAVNRTAAAKGQLGSGNRLYDLTKYGQGLASQQYGNTVSQLGNLINKTPITNVPYTTTSIYGGASLPQQSLNLGGVY